MKKELLFLFILSLFLSACLYEPEPYVDTSVPTQGGQTSDFGRIYPVNTGKQICNPSISNDIVNYPASILWLNFSGTLVLNDPPPDFSLTKVVQHDRLTVSDTAGRVQWFVMRDSVGVQCQFQDPEWSTHPNFLIALAGFDSKGKANCQDIDYGIIGVRLADKKAFWFYDSAIPEEGFPHLWVEPSAVPDPLSADSLVQFFGTREVQVVFVDQDNDIAWVNYAKSDKSVKLKKPQDRALWKVDSPLISADGKWIVYNLMNNAYTWEAYIQELSAHSVPVKIPLEPGMLSAPAQPHWWSFEGRVFVLWAEFPSGQTMLNKADFLNSSVQDGSVGRTSMREVLLTSGGVPSDMAVEWVGAVREVAKVPMTGGRSPDGFFMATGTNYGYLLLLP